MTHVADRIAIFTFIASTYTLMVTLVCPFDITDHNFMVPGHSYLPNDRDFGVIEQAKRRRQQIYIPSEWYELVRSACRTSLFTVVEMSSENFVAIKELMKLITNREVDTLGRSVDWLTGSQYAGFRSERKLHLNSVSDEV